MNALASPHIPHLQQLLLVVPFNNEPGCEPEGLAVAGPSVIGSGKPRDSSAWHLLMFESYSHAGDHLRMRSVPSS